MTNTCLNPDAMARPASNCSQGVLVPSGARMLFVSGQLGLEPDGTPCDGLEAQMRRAMANVFTVLSAARMGTTDTVKLTVYTTDDSAEAVSVYRRVRDELLGEHAPAALYAVVSRFTSPDHLVEIEAVAAGT